MRKKILREFSVDLIEPRIPLNIVSVVLATVLSPTTPGNRNLTDLINTPGTAGGPGGRDRMLAVKSRKKRLENLKWVKSKRRRREKEKERKTERW